MDIELLSVSSPQPQLFTRSDDNTSIFEPSSHGDDYIAPALPKICQNSPLYTSSLNLHIDDNGCLPGEHVLAIVPSSYLLLSDTGIDEFVSDYQMKKPLEHMAKHHHGAQVEVILTNFRLFLVLSESPWSRSQITTRDQLLVSPVSAFLADNPMALGGMDDDQTYSTHSCLLHDCHCDDVLVQLPLPLIGGIKASVPSSHACQTGSERRVPQQPPTQGHRRPSLEDFATTTVGSLSETTGNSHPTDSTFARMVAATPTPTLNSLHSPSTSPPTAPSVSDHLPHSPVSQGSLSSAASIDASHNPSRVETPYTGSPPLQEQAMQSLHPASPALTRDSFRQSNSVLCTGGSEQSANATHLPMASTPSVHHQGTAHSSTGSSIPRTTPICRSNSRYSAYRSRYVSPSLSSPPSSPRDDMIVTEPAQARPPPMQHSAHHPTSSRQPVAIVALELKIPLSIMICSDLLIVLPFDRLQLASFLTNLSSYAFTLRLTSRVKDAKWLRMYQSHPQRVVKSAQQVSCLFSDWTRTSLLHLYPPVSNHNYSICDSYPSALLLPPTFTTTELKSASEFRSKKRVPFISYINASSQSVLIRCSQPNSGWGNRSLHDETLIKQIKSIANSLPRGHHHAPPQQLIHLPDPRLATPPPPPALASHTGGGRCLSGPCLGDCEELSSGINHAHIHPSGAGATDDDGGCMATTTSGNQPHRSLVSGPLHSPQHKDGPNTPHLLTAPGLTPTTQPSNLAPSPCPPCHNHTSIPPPLSCGHHTRFFPASGIRPLVDRCRPNCPVCDVNTASLPVSGPGLRTDDDIGGDADFGYPDTGATAYHVGAPSHRPQYSEDGLTPLQDDLDGKLEARIRGFSFADDFDEDLSHTHTNNNNNSNNNKTAMGEPLGFQTPTSNHGTTQHDGSGSFLTAHGEDKGGSNATHTTSALDQSFSLVGSADIDDSGDGSVHPGPASNHSTGCHHRHQHQCEPSTPIPMHSQVTMTATSTSCRAQETRNTSPSHRPKHPVDDSPILIDCPPSSRLSGIPRLDSFDLSSQPASFVDVQGESIPSTSDTISSDTTALPPPTNSNRRGSGSHRHIDDDTPIIKHSNPASCVVDQHHFSHCVSPIVRATPTLPLSSRGRRASYAPQKEKALGLPLCASLTTTANTLSDNTMNPDTNGRPVIPPPHPKHNPLHHSNSRRHAYPHPLPSSNASTSQQYPLIFFDCRPYASALTNAIVGKGFESVQHYDASLEFLNIPNIHHMRNSYATHQKNILQWRHTMYDYQIACIKQFNDQHTRLVKRGGHNNNYRTSSGSPNAHNLPPTGAAGLQATQAHHESPLLPPPDIPMSRSGSSHESTIPYTGQLMAEVFLKSDWVKQQALIISSAVKVSRSLINKTSCVVHCSDNFDRTTQLCLLVQIICDPYYRTLHGFCSLFDREFFKIGHRICDRLLLGHCWSLSSWSDLFQNPFSSKQPPSTTAQQNDNNRVRSNHEASNSVSHTHSNQRMGYANGGDSSPTPAGRPPTSISSSSSSSYTNAAISTTTGDPDTVSPPQHHPPSGNSSSSSNPPSSLGASIPVESTAGLPSVKDIASSFTPSLSPPELLLQGKTGQFYQYSPIFIQLIECIYQLVCQFPSQFEFNTKFLYDLIYSAFSGQFEIFEYNSDCERPHESTILFWSHFLSEANYARYVYDGYAPTEQPLTPQTQTCDIRIWPQLYLSSPMLSYFQLINASLQQTANKQPLQSSAGTNTAASSRNHTSTLPLSDSQQPASGPTQKDKPKGYLDLPLHLSIDTKCCPPFITETDKVIRDKVKSNDLYLFVQRNPYLNIPLPRKRAQWYDFILNFGGDA